jgi:hypothetical protein
MGALSPEKNGLEVKLNIHLYPVPWSRKLGSVYPLPVLLHGVVLS